MTLSDEAKLRQELSTTWRLYELEREHNAKLKQQLAARQTLYHELLMAYEAQAEQQLAKVTEERDEAVSAVQRLTEGVPFDAVVIADGIRRGIAQQLAAKDADANRYRWLRTYKFAHNGECWHSQYGPVLRGETLDEAVDKAMQ